VILIVSGKCVDIFVPDIHIRNGIDHDDLGNYATLMHDQWERNQVTVILNPVEHWGRDLPVV
jgi:hypothetical protein